MIVNMEIAEAIAANATVDNVFTGQRFERAPFDGMLTLLVTGSAAGLEHELNIGGRSISPRVPANTQNRSPVVPDDLIVAEVEVFEGELVQLTGVNTTAGALTLRARVLLEAIEYDEEYY